MSNQYIEVKCFYCGKPVLKLLREYNRQIKKNTNVRFFCNLSCTRFQINKENPPKGNIENFKNIKNKRGRKKDEYSIFRKYVSRGRERDKKRNYEFNLTVEYLKKLWEEQQGICPFTGWQLILPKSTDYPWKEKSPKNASLDRIDNSKGYIEGNVRFISYMANIGRQTFLDEQLIEFCKAVANKH